MDPLSLPDAFLGVALCAFHADGDEDRSEWDLLSHRLRALPEFAAIQLADLRARIPALAERRAATGTDAFVRDCASAIPVALRREAYAVAAGVVAADGRLATNERAFLSFLASRLGLPPQP